MQQNLAQTLVASGKYTLATDEEIEQFMADPWKWCRPMGARTGVQKEPEPSQPQEKREPKPSGGMNR
jgi:hypothetical protein